MRQFVSDRRAGIPVIGCVIFLGIVKRRLQYSGRKVDVVHLRIEVCIHSWRCHAPLVQVNRLAKLVPLASIFKASRTQHIAEVVVGFHIQRRVVPPRCGIANLVSNRMQLAQGFRLGRRAHPVQVLNLVLHGRLNLFGHQLCLRLGVGCKRAPYKLLSQGLAQVAVHSPRTRLPARRHGLHAAQRLGEKVEIGLFERMRKVGRRSRHQVKAEIAAQGRHVFRRQLGAKRLHELRLRDVEPGHTRRALHLEVMSPVNRWCEF